MSDGKNTGEHANKASKKAQWPMAEITHALALEPRVAIAYVRFAIFYKNEGMLDETAAVLDKGLAVAPDDEILLMMRRDVETTADLRQRARL